MLEAGENVLAGQRRTYVPVTTCMLASVLHEVVFGLARDHFAAGLAGKTKRHEISLERRCSTLSRSVDCSGGADGR